MVRASEGIVIVGLDPASGFRSGLFNDGLGDADAGDILITTPSLIVDGGRITTDTTGPARAGSIRIDGPEQVDIVLRNEGQLFSGTNAGGAGGDIVITRGGRIEINGVSDASSATPDAPGQIFGEIALLDGKERTADAAAMGPTTLLMLDRRDFIPFVESNPKVAIRLIEVLCERVRRTSEMVESVAFLDYSARLAKLLLQLAQNYGKETKDGLLIDLKLSQQDLGNLIASTRESVNRQLNAWVQEGALQLERGQITILDLDAMEEHAQPMEDF